MSYVYFIQARDCLRIKIGVAVDPAQRLRLLQTGAPEPLSIIGIVPGDVNLEAELHRRFRAYRVIGEWFSEHEELLEYIRENTVLASDTAKQPSPATDQRSHNQPNPAPAPAQPRETREAEPFSRTIHRNGYTLVLKFEPGRAAEARWDQAFRLLAETPEPEP